MERGVIRHVKKRKSAGLRLRLQPALQTGTGLTGNANIAFEALSRLHSIPDTHELHFPEPAHFFQGVADEQRLGVPIGAGIDGLRQIDHAQSSAGIEHVIGGKIAMDDVTRQHDLDIAQRLLQ